MPPPLPLPSTVSVSSLLSAARSSTASPSPARVPATFAGDTMGTRYAVALALPAADDGLVARAHAAVDAAVQQVDRLMSTWKPDSELSRLNRAPTGRPFPMSPLTVAVLAEAARVSELSDGAFDVTAGRLVNAWGFGPEGGARLVDEATRDALRRTVGWRHLVLDAPACTATKAVDGLHVDLSAIAKGFGVDEASRALDALGLHDHLVEVGGEVRARGTRADGRPWQVGIEQPQAAGPRKARYAVPLADASLATSGDYRICFHHDGRRYSHEIDPRTGAPIDHPIASVSVIDTDCTRADAMTTALMVLGLDAGLALAERLGIAALFLVREGEGLRDVATSAFARAGARRLGT